MIEDTTVENAALRAQLYAARAERDGAVSDAEATARQRDSAQYAAQAENVRADRAQARLDLVDQLHQPYTVQKWTPCDEHADDLMQQVACAMCAERPVQMCTARCGAWPCASHDALHNDPVDGEPLKEEVTIGRDLFEKLFLAAEYVAGSRLGPCTSAKEALAEIAERPWFR